MYSKIAREGSRRKIVGVEKVACGVGPYVRGGAVEMDGGV